MDPQKRKRSRDAELNEQIMQLAKDARLESWNSFVEELKVPSEVAPALITMRPELLKAITPRALTADEALALYKLIGGLIETNTALRAHAQHVSTMVHDWVGSMYGMVSVASRIERFAEFRHNDAAAEEDEGESGL